MSDADAAGVVIVGAGVVGCAAARELAPDHDVHVVDAGQVAGATTAKASGLVSIVADYPEHPDAARYAMRFFREYDGTGQFSFTERPSVSLATEDGLDDAWAFGEQVAEHGFDVTFHDRASLEDRFPGVFDLDTFAGGVEYADTGWVDPYTFATTLQADAEDRGATFETGTEVTGVLVEDDAVAGVQTERGPIHADHVVVAAGWRTRDLVAEFVEIPTRPFRYQWVNVETDRAFGDDYPIAWERLTRFYWRPEHNGDLHVGGGTYFVDPPGDVRSGATAAFKRTVAEHVTDYLQGIDDARLSGDATCPTGDAATPDGYPVLDAPSDAPDGLVVATGMHGFGIMAAPVAGRAVRALVAGEDAPFPVDGFALDRFDSRTADFESAYIREPGSEWE
ncbi:NAD(P)/FAD-dependent oxidoreductase [Halobacteriaceae archaeon GCM10025711]